MDTQLRPITVLVRERRYEEARAALRDYLNEHSGSAYAWYLLSFAAVTLAERRQAIRRAADLAPEDSKYAARLAQLGASPSPSRRPVLVLLAIALVGIVALAFIALSRLSTTSGDQVLPTLAVLSSPMPQPELQGAVIASPTVLALSPTVETNPSATATHSPTPTPPRAAATNTPPQPTTTAANVTNVVNPTPGAITQASAPAAPSDFTPPAIQPVQGTLPPAATLPEGSTPTPTPPGATLVPGLPTLTPGGDPGVPLSTPLDIGAGEMRIVAVTRPASSLIAELGGSATAPPAGQEWVLLEALVICTGTENCAPDPGDMRLAGASGAVYAPATDLSMPQPFGPDGYALGQVWGYMGFRVPVSETGLRLVLSQNGQTYIFAL